MVYKLCEGETQTKRERENDVQRFARRSYHRQHSGENMAGVGGGAIHMLRRILLLWIVNRNVNIHFHHFMYVLIPKMYGTENSTNL